MFHESSCDGITTGSEGHTVVSVPASHLKRNKQNVILSSAEGWLLPFWRRLGWSDLPLFSIFENGHIAAVLVYFFYLKYKKITVIVLRLIVRSEGISCMYMDLSIILSLSGWEFQKSVFRIWGLLSWSGSGSDFYPESGLAKKSGSDPDPWKKKMWKYLTHFAGNII